VDNGDIVDGIEQNELGDGKMAWTDVLAVNAGILAITMLALWAYCVRIRDVSVIDSFWPFGMVILAGSSFAMTGGARGAQSVALFALTAIWGLRLAIHLFNRWRAHGEDPRYVAILGRLMEKRGWSFAKASFIQVFLMQYVLLFVVCLPAQIGSVMDVDQELSLIGMIGVVMAVIGILFETIGDAQLKAFRDNPSMAGKVLDTGLWRYTRHPNYFGDACTWWGIWIIAARSPLGLASIIGPILLTFLLTRVSGVPMLEHRLKKNRPGYAEYLRRTSSFFPWPPKKG
jgi:steroid 5-alpha reductase family enzyme